MKERSRNMTVRLEAKLNLVEQKSNRLKKNAAAQPLQRLVMEIREPKLSLKKEDEIAAGGLAMLLLNLRVCTTQEEMMVGIILVVVLEQALARAINLRERVMVALEVILLLPNKEVMVIQ
ncbi:unnamed protein product [Amoebophrya sp. A25]|nr:unnamed protein product [Amoebophrya sp. A25]|eukprot:GSA25T00004080001.1